MTIRVRVAWCPLYWVRNWWVQVPYASITNTLRAEPQAVCRISIGPYDSIRYNNFSYLLLILYSTTPIKYYLFSYRVPSCDSAKTATGVIRLDSDWMALPCTVLLQPFTCALITKSRRMWRYWGRAMTSPTHRSGHPWLHRLVGQKWVAEISGHSISCMLRFKLILWVLAY